MRVHVCIHTCIFFMERELLHVRKKKPYKFIYVLFLEKNNKYLEISSIAFIVS